MTSRISLEQVLFKQRFFIFHKNLDATSLIRKHNFIMVRYKPNSNPRNLALVINEHDIAACTGKVGKYFVNAAQYFKCSYLYTLCRAGVLYFLELRRLTHLLYILDELRKHTFMLYSTDKLQ